MSTYQSTTNPGIKARVANPLISLIVPVFNEEQSVAMFMDAVVNKLAGLRLEIIFIDDGKEIWSHQGIMTSEEFYKALGEFKLGKSSEAYNVAFNEGTDRRFCEQYEIFKDTPEGVFVDKLSGRPLFDTAYRFDSKSGWLSFTQPVENEVYEKIDTSYGMIRTEIRSVSSDIHLGHVFNDGPNGLPRYCINATVLEFVPRG